MVKEINHIGLSVSNMERSLGLYCDALGMELLSDVNIEGLPDFGTVIGLPGVRERIVMLLLNNCRIELFQFFEPKGKKMERRQCDLGYMHLAFMVDHLDEICSKLREKGIEFYSPEPIDLGAGPCIFFKGLDGETIELMQRTVQ